MKAKTLISVVGPTAIGKTSLAISLAKHYSTEIISADSRQFYKELKIGTAVPSEKELISAKHHCIQHISIFDHYSVGDFEKEAIAILDDLFKTNDIAILVGGSGLYVDAVTNGLDDFPTVPSSYREALNKTLEQSGIGELQHQLRILDEAYYDKVDLENPHRLIRALEICMATGKPYSSFLRKKNVKRPFTTLTIGLKAERETIYNRINQRVDIMIGNGLLEEARQVYPHRTLNALQTVGYKELFNYFDGTWTLDFAISEIKKNTRRFAKRQMTWYRKNEQICWFNSDDDPSLILEGIDDKLTELTHG
ncbi:tRNA (adenosine(37)-N6)-dimethylallyltransferase MiaA [Maribacter sp. ANRC-HE7]|uniref:tRNA dimethylallyltransferase n=1 Tax=Maribacter aquimaris TaxID=2737171 RepID=A0ABR7UWM3_9FLAO|nr:tRNA (adenosine(37)-N6)-dimethylallyltransferase MiaA [Maribacter aquimaris]MBD0776531.1 tRNA (adenosine(37)-N6)-dimethylallyltransferase MiaA [Maribacter aquimaris]